MCDVYVQKERSCRRNFTYSNWLRNFWSIKLHEISEPVFFSNYFHCRHLHEMSKPCFWEKNIVSVICLNIYQVCLGEPLPLYVQKSSVDNDVLLNFPRKQDLTLDKTCMKC